MDDDCKTLRYDKMDKINGVSRSKLSGIYNSKTLQERYDKIAGKIKRLYNLYAESGDALLLETIKENQEELTNISKLIDHENATHAATMEIDRRNDLAKNLRNVWPSLTIDEKHRALRTFIDKIILYQDNIEIHYNF